MFGNDICGYTYVLPLSCYRCTWIQLLESTFSKGLHVLWRLYYVRVVSVRLHSTTVGVRHLLVHAVYVISLRDTPLCPGKHATMGYVPDKVVHV